MHSLQSFVRYRPGSTEFYFLARGYLSVYGPSKKLVQSGNYLLDGYGMYLTPENGERQNYSFMFMPKEGGKDPKGLIVGNE